MADSKLSGLPFAGTYSDADLLYIVQGGSSYQTTWGALRAALAAIIEYPEVANYAALPAAASHNGEIYVCLASQGTGWLFTLKESGFYRSDGAAWTRLGALPADYFTDSVLYIADDSDPTKVCKFQLSGITTGTTRTLTIPNASGTIMLVGDAPTAHAASHQSGGGDAIKIDDLATGDDNTDLDATTSKHGLMPKADKAKLDKIYAAKADVASAGTIDLDAAASDLIEITGTTTITAITLAAGMHRIVRFQGALTLTNGASLILPGGANITTAAGDFAIFRGYASSVVRCVAYTKANGQAVVGGGGGLGYTLPVGCIAFSPNDSTAYYFGASPIAASATAAARRVYIPIAGTITAAELWWFSNGTAGSNENVTMEIRLNNTSNTTIATVGDTAAQKRFSNTGLSIAVAQGDYLEITFTSPAWATNPTNVVMYGNLYIAA